MVEDFSGYDDEKEQDYNDIDAYGNEFQDEQITLCEEEDEEQPTPEDLERLPITNGSMQNIFKRINVQEKASTNRMKWLPPPDE